MLRFIARRVLIAIPILAIVVSFTFFLVQLIPGNPAQTILGKGATAAQIAAVNHQLGLDQPIGIRFLAFWGNTLRGNLGVSLINGQPVAQSIANALPVTLSLAISATLLTGIVGIGLGVLSAVRGGAVDRIVQGSSSVGMALPSFWLAVALVLVFSILLKLLPATGYTPITQSPGQWAYGMVLPVVAIGLAGVASISRQTRSAMLETLGKDYVRSLRAQGLPTRSIIYKHALRNASIPIVTNVGFQFIGVLGGAVIIEQIFALPGIGQLTNIAVSQHDIPVVQGAVIVTAAIVLLVNLLVDVIYLILNPKTRRA
ncbi:MAG TPA: ABC transporter permease [Galbitalea sp.]|jgi:peptide/nickel transport system permease protein|nr:ABC transporter permease [Galbitalea sp.]